MEYEYYMTHSANGLLNVDDIGNCAIDIFNDLGEEMVMVIDTLLGQTRILTFGPFNPDFERLPDSVICDLQQLHYSESQIGKVIRKFLNNWKFGATQAFIIDKDEALDKCRNIIDYMRQSIY